MADLLVFGQRIKQLRQGLHLSQRDFAKKIDVTASALSAYETGIKNPSVNVAINIATVFGISVDWLCGLRDAVNRFQEDSDTPFDLPSALTGLLLLQSNGLIESTGHSADGSINAPVEKLEVKDTLLQAFLYEIHLFDELYYMGSLSPETYTLCVEEVTNKVAEDIKEFRKRKADEFSRQAVDPSSPF